MRHLVLLVGLALLGPAAAQCPSAVPTLDYRVLARHPHNPAAFTQGLEFHAGELLESSGGYGRSFLARGPAGEAYRRQRPLPAAMFAEGLSMHDGRIWLLSWKRGELLLLDPESLQITGGHRYRGEGWGLCSDGRRLYLSDGSASLSLREDENFREIGRLEVLAGQRPVHRLNELECVDGQIYANLWGQDRIARIDASSGCVNAWLELEALWPAAQRPASADVLNGIAWRDGHLWVTGKRWPHLYQLELLP